MLSQMVKFSHFYDEYSIAYLLHIFNAHNILCKILSFTDDIPDKCTLFLLLEVDHTLSHLLWKWNDEERKIGERGWGWEQVKEKHGKEDGNSNWRFLQLIHFHMNQNQKKQKIVIKHYSSSLKKKKANCLIQIYVTL